MIYERARRVFAPGMLPKYNEIIRVEPLVEANVILLDIF